VKYLASALAVLVLALQYPLWLGKGGWTRVWELERSLADAPPETTVLVDCLSLWVANVFETSPAEEIAERAAAFAVGRAGLTIAVTNEVGLGIVPDNELARRYRDVLGRVNATWAAAADEAYFVVAGRALGLE